MSSKLKTRPSTAKIPPFGLRLQPALKAALEKAAKQNGRSLNAEITARLEATFGSEGALPGRSPAEVLASPEGMSELQGLLESIRAEIASLNKLQQRIEGTRR